MNTKSSAGLLGAGIVALLVSLVVCGFALTGGPSQETNEPQAGSLSGPDISSRYLQWGGVSQWNTGVYTAATSSVICSIQAPAATSTITLASLLVSASGLNSPSWSISTSTTNVGSSTPAFAQFTAMATGTPYVWTPGGVSTTTNGTLVLNSTNSTGGSSYIIAPNQYVNFRIATGTPSTFASYITGKCQATFVAL